MHLCIPVRTKFFFTLTVAAAWFVCAHLALPWIHSLPSVVPQALAIVLAAFIALIPAFMYALIAVSLFVDTRTPLKLPAEYPPLSVLVEAFNEEERIGERIESIMRQEYPGELEIIVVDIGSTDRTLEIIRMSRRFSGVKILAASHDGKANALNLGLQAAAHTLVITLDADTCLYRNELRKIVDRLLADPADTPCRGWNSTLTEFPLQRDRDDRAHAGVGLLSRNGISQTDAVPVRGTLAA